MSNIYYYHANPIENSDKEFYYSSPTVIPYDYNHSTYFSDRIYHSRNLNSRFYVITFGYQVGWTNASVIKRVCNRYTIHFVFGGTGKFNGHSVGKNDVYIAMPNEEHTISLHTDGRMIHGWIALAGRELEKMVDILHLPKQAIFSISPNQMERIQAMFLETIYQDHSDVDMSFYLLSQFFQSLYIAVPPLPQRNEVDNKYVHRGLEYISDNYFKNITNSDVARAINISESYLHKLFLKELNASPQAVLAEKRISVAKSLLDDETLKIVTVAQMCGFSNESSFWKVFKKQTGLSPTEYRKTRLKVQSSEKSNKLPD